MVIYYGTDMYKNEENYLKGYINAIEEIKDDFFKYDNRGNCGIRGNLPYEMVKNSKLDIRDNFGELMSKIRYNKENILLDIGFDEGFIISVNASNKNNFRIETKVKLKNQNELIYSEDGLDLMELDYKNIYFGWNEDKFQNLMNIDYIEFYIVDNKYNKKELVYDLCKLMKLKGIVDKFDDDKNNKEFKDLKSKLLKKYSLGYNNSDEVIKWLKNELIYN